MVGLFQFEGDERQGWQSCENTSSVQTLQYSLHTLWRNWKHGEPCEARTPDDLLRVEAEESY